MGIRRSTRTFSTKRMAEVARGLLDASTLCAISTVSPRCRAHVNTAYFAWDAADLRLVWLSDPQARHSRNLRSSEVAAVAVFDSTQTWGKPDRGIQLFGAAREAAGAAERQAERVYADRFPAFKRQEHRAYRLYVFQPQRIKLFNEPALGGGVVVTAKVGPGASLAWERTEIYHAS